MRAGLLATLSVAGAVVVLSPASSNAQVAGPVPAAAPALPPVTLHSEVENEGVFSFDYSVPTSPALALAGLSTDKSTVSSASLKPFVLSLPAVFSGTGGQSAAVDFAPAAILQGPAKQSFDHYTNPDKWLYRLAFRTRFNAALYNGVDGNGDASKNNSSRLALGASISLLDSSDPLMATDEASRKHGTTVWMQCLGEQEAVIAELAGIRPEGQAGMVFALQNRVQVAAWTEPDAHAFAADPSNAQEIGAALGVAVSFDGMSDAEIRAKLGEYSVALNKKFQALQDAQNAALAADARSVALQKAAKQCATTATSAAMSGDAINLGGGALLRGDPGHIRNFREAGSVFWASARHQLARIYNGNDVSGYLMVGAFARVGRGEYVATGDKTAPEIRANTQDYWAGLEYYNLDFKLAAQYGWTKTDARDPTQQGFSKKGSRYLLSATHRIAVAGDGTWLGLSYGNARGTVDSLKGHIFLVTLDFAPVKPFNIFGLGK